MLGLLVISSSVAVLLAAAKCQILTDTHVDVPTWRSLFVLHVYGGAIWPCHFRCAPLHALLLLLHINLLSFVLAAICYSLALKTAPEAAIGVVASVICSNAPLPLINMILFFYEFDARDEKHRTLLVVHENDGVGATEGQGQHDPAEQREATTLVAVDESFVFDFDDNIDAQGQKGTAADEGEGTNFPTSSDRSTPSTEPGQEESRSEWMPITTHAMWSALGLMILVVLLVTGNVSLTAALDAAGKCDSSPSSAASFPTLLWASLLVDALLAQSIYVGGVYFFRLMTSDDSDNLWRELHPFNGEWRMCKDKAPPTNREIAITRLAQDDGDSSAWCMLGKTMSHQEIVKLPTAEAGVSRRDCYTNALRLDPTSARAWKGMGHCLWPGESIEVEGEQWVRSSCYAQALELKSEDPLLWYQLGNALAVTEAVSINAKVRTAQDCYSESLRRNQGHSMAWNNLGATLPLTGMADIAGRCMTKRMCFTEALKVDGGKNVTAWNNLASSLGRDEQAQLSDGTVVSKRDCCVEALRQDSSSSAAWNKLGTTLAQGEAIALHGRRWTRADCYVQALRISPKFAAAWNNLGSALSQSDVVVISGRSFKRQACFIEALRHCPCYSAAWDNLGWTMEAQDPPVDVGGEMFGRAACFIRVVETSEAFKVLNCDEARGK